MTTPPSLVPVRKLMHLAMNAVGRSWTPEMSALFTDCEAQADHIRPEISEPARHAWSDVVAHVRQARFQEGGDLVDRDLVKKLARYNALASLELAPVDPEVTKRLAGKPWLGLRFGDR